MAKDLVKIKKELTDAATKNRYKDKSHEAIAALLVTQPGKVSRESIDTGMLRAAVTKSDFGKLKPSDSSYWSMLVTGDGLPLTPTVKAELAALFDAASVSGLAIAALMFRDTTLAEELGIPGVTASDVADALRDT